MPPKRSRAKSPSSLHKSAPSILKHLGNEWSVEDVRGFLEGFRVHFAGSEDATDWKQIAKGLGRSEEGVRELYRQHQTLLPKAQTRVSVSTLHKAVLATFHSLQGELVASGEEESVQQEKKRRKKSTAKAEVKGKMKRVTKVAKGKGKVTQTKGKRIKSLSTTSATASASRATATMAITTSTTTSTTKAKKRVSESPVSMSPHRVLVSSSSHQSQSPAEDLPPTMKVTELPWVESFLLQQRTSLSSLSRRKKTTLLIRPLLNERDSPSPSGTSHDVGSPGPTEQRLPLKLRKKKRNIGFLGLTFTRIHPILDSALAQPRLLRALSAEFFMSGVDFFFFKQKEFAHCMEDLQIPKGIKLSRTEWAYARGILGNFRRFSKALIRDEKKNLERYRKVVRKVQSGKAPHGEEENAILRKRNAPFAFAPGQQVLVFEPESALLIRGSIVRKVGLEQYLIAVTPPMGYQGSNGAIVQCIVGTSSSPASSPASLSASSSMPSMILVKDELVMSLDRMESIASAPLRVSSSPSMASRGGGPSNPSHGSSLSHVSSANLSGEFQQRPGLVMGSSSPSPASSSYLSHPRQVFIPYGHEQQHTGPLFSPFVGSDNHSTYTIEAPSWSSVDPRLLILLEYAVRKKEKCIQIVKDMNDYAEFSGNPITDDFRKRYASVIIELRDTNQRLLQPLLSLLSGRFIGHGKRGGGSGDSVVRGQNGSENEGMKDADQDGVRMGLGGGPESIPPIESLEKATEDIFRVIRMGKGPGGAQHGFSDEERKDWKWTWFREKVVLRHMVLALTLHFILEKPNVSAAAAGSIVNRAIEHCSPHFWRNLPLHEELSRKVRSLFDMILSASKTSSTAQAPTTPRTPSRGMYS